jgi:hypothetical protein
MFAEQRGEIPELVGRGIGHRRIRDPSVAPRKREIALLQMLFQRLGSSERRRAPNTTLLIASPRAVLYLFLKNKKRLEAVNTLET